MIGPYEVEVRVHSYRNPTGRCDGCREENNTDPGCCDELTIRPMDETCPKSCDTTLVICTTPLESDGTNYQTFIQASTIFIDCNDSLEFDSSSFGLSNPALLVEDKTWEVRKLL